jgi:hypothetical protein
VRLPMRKACSGRGALVPMRGGGGGGRERDWGEREREWGFACQHG